ncbi:MAG: CidA/LrgA family protein [Pseudomonadota bacterium]|nr:CidA/LrgA family protein [Pseudomonadota bacterium]
MKPLQGLAWLLVLQLGGEVLARLLKLPYPGPVLGMLLLLVALRWRAVREPVVLAAEFLLQHLSLLFVPVGVGVVTHLDLLAQQGLQLLLVIVLSTWAGLAVTALTLRALMRSTDEAAPTQGGDA